MEKSVFLLRMEKIREKMKKEGVDVFLVSPSSNLFYLTGCGLRGGERLFLLVLPAEGEPFILANLMHREQIKSLPVGGQVFWKDGEDPVALLAAESAGRNIRMKKAALEPRMPAFFTLPLAAAFPESVFVLGSSLTDPLRKRKDASELALIRKACGESDLALAALMERGGYWIGKTESDFLRALSDEFTSRGLSSFGASVQVGANAAIPHHTSGKTRIEKGACLLVDFWGRYKGYYTDCTRTFHFGKPSAEFEKIYALVLEAHLAAEAAARPGNTLGDADFAARSLIEKAGYGEYFTHRLGHGLGIDVHEGDSVNRGVNVPIEPGMVFSVEPGIYLPGRFGVRIENLVATGETAPELLHSFPRELRIIE